MTRHDLEFQVHYSIILEEMQQRLMGRLDRWCTFLQLLAGSATVASLLPPVPAGIVVALLAGVQIVWQPAALAMEAKIQRNNYLSVLQQMPGLDDGELFKRLRALDSADSSVAPALSGPAYVAACLRLGLPVPDRKWRLGWLATVLSFFAGELPRRV